MTIILTNCFRHALLFEDTGGEYNIGLVANAKSVREFDDGLTRGKWLFCYSPLLEAK